MDIRDHYPKYVVTLNEMDTVVVIVGSHKDENGIKIIAMLFLE